MQLMRIDETDLREHSAVVDMSFASLPASIHHKIALFTIGDVNFKRPPISLGKALSSVCKSLQAHGQRIVWYCVKVDFAKLASSPPQVLLEFERYPHLHAHVKELEAVNDTSLATEQYEAPMKIMTKLANFCRTLEDIQNAISPEPHPNQIRQLFMIASRIKSLTALALLSIPLKVDREVINRLQKGFGETTQLAITLEIPPSFPAMVDLYRTPFATRSVLDYLAIDAPDIRPQHIPLLRVLLRQSCSLSPSIKSNFQTDFFSPMTFQWIFPSRTQLSTGRFVRSLPLRSRQ